MSINLVGVKWSRVLPYLVILILSIFLLKECTKNKDSEVKVLKNEVASLKASSKKYIDKANKLEEEIVVLESKKSKVKTKIVYLKEATKSKLEKVPSLTTKQQAIYYQNRYKKPVVVTQYGVSLSDSIAKENIKETIQKDECFEEIKLVKTELAIEEEKSRVKDTINSNLKKANSILIVANDTQEQIIKDTEKSVTQEKSRKTFWQVTAGTIVLISSYLLLTN